MWRCVVLLLTLAVLARAEVNMEAGEEVGKEAAKETAKEAGQEGARPPNIVLVVVDDVGWADLGYNNPHGSAIPTPGLDQVSVVSTLYLYLYLHYLAGEGGSAAGLALHAPHLHPQQGGADDRAVLCQHGPHLRHVMFRGLRPYYVISYNKQGSFQMITDDYNNGPRVVRKDYVLWKIQNMQESASMPSSSGQSQFSIMSLMTLKLKLKN